MDVSRRSFLTRLVGAALAAPLAPAALLSGASVGAGGVGVCVGGFLDDSAFTESVAALPLTPHSGELVARFSVDTSQFDRALAQAEAVLARAAVAEGQCHPTERCEEAGPSWPRVPDAVIDIGVSPSDVCLITTSERTP